MLRSATRAVGRRARVAGSCVAFHGLRAASGFASSPPPTQRRRRARLQPLRGFRVLRAAPAPPAAPRGSQATQTPAAALWPPPGRKSGLGLPAGRPGSAPDGRDASPARLAGGAGPRWFPSAPAPAERRAALAACRGLSGPLARAASGAAGRRRGQGGRRVDAHVPSLD
jgi:hypothetical protein